MLIAKKRIDYSFVVLLWIMEGRCTCIFYKSQAKIKGQWKLIIKQSTMLCKLVLLLLTLIVYIGQYVAR